VAKKLELDKNIFFDNVILFQGEDKHFFQNLWDRSKIGIDIFFISFLVRFFQRHHRQFNYSIVMKKLTYKTSLFAFFY